MTRDLVTIEWTDESAGSVPTLRGPDGSLEVEASEYLMELFDDLASRGKPPEAILAAMEAAGYALKSFLSYWHGRRGTSRRVENINVSWKNTNDKTLAAYRDAVWAEIRSNARSRGMRQAQRSTNIKLRHVYVFLKWCQERGYCSPKMLGLQGCRVRSSLVACETSDAPHLHRSDAMYPVFFRRTGTKSSTGKPQHFPTKEEIEAVENYFHEKCGALVASRNILLLHLGEHAGWRCGSVNSLRLGDFSEQAIANAQARGDGKFEVTPSKQKFGFDFVYSVPWPLALAVQRYISKGGEREQLLASARGNAASSEDHIFVSARKGTPLKNHTLSQLFSDAFRAVGAPKGSGYHSLKRAFGDYLSKAEVQRRKRDGDSLALEDVAEALREPLGHSTTQAQTSYRRTMATLMSESVEEQLREQLAAEQLRNASLESRLRYVEGLLRDRGS